MVSRRIICSPPGHENSLRRNDLHGTGSGNITMFEYIAKIIEELPMELDGEPTSPAANHLFEVDDNRSMPE